MVNIGIYFQYRVFLVAVSSILVGCEGASDLCSEGVFYDVPDRDVYELVVKMLNEKSVNFDSHNDRVCVSRKDGGLLKNVIIKADKEVYPSTQVYIGRSKHLADKIKLELERSNVNYKLKKNNKGYYFISDKERFDKLKAIIDSSTSEFIKKNRSN